VECCKDFHSFKLKEIESLHRIYANKTLSGRFTPGERGAGNPLVGGWAGSNKPERRKMKSSAVKTQIYVSFKN